MFFFATNILLLIQLLHIVIQYLSIMDQLRNNLPTSERFTAEQVRKFLGLNDYYSNSSSSSSSDCENDNLSDISSDINTNQSESDEEDIIPPSPKRGKRTQNKSEQKIDGISKNKAGKHNISTTGSTSNPLYENTVSVQYQTSHSTQSLPSHNIPAVLRNQHQHVEIETPTMTNHVEHNVENVILDNAVPEPVFTIDLGIQMLPGSPLQNENHVQIIHTPVHEISENVLVPVPLQNNTNDTTSIQNGITLPTNTLPLSDSHNQQIQVTHPPNSFQDTLSSDVEDTNDYYEVQTELPNTDSNVQFTPIVNYQRDEILDCDVEQGWEKIQPDIIPDHCPFTGTQGINMSTDSRLPEDFFNDIFDDRMFTIMVEETNNYAQKKVREIMQGRDHFQQIDHHSHRQHAHLGTWRDINASDIKIFIAHLLVMSSVHKTALHNYWSTTTLSRTPFFGQYIGRNKFQDILWNLHICDTTNNPTPGSPNHDPLAKV